MQVKSLLQPRVLLEAFVWANLAFLAPDIFVAHSMNQFAAWPEWIPLVFSMIAPGGLIVAWILSRRWPCLGRGLGLVLGATSVVIGVTGLILHLGGGFFADQTLKNLVYTAPLVAPLAYAGIGLLIILNRTRVANDQEWSQWVLVLALGGFAGNFVLSLADHAQNGFFLWEEWIPVVASALAIGFVTGALHARVNRAFLGWCALCMAVQMIVGVLGFYFHAVANLDGPSDHWFENFVFGAPIFAPLLLPNLAMLGLLGLWSLSRTLTEADPIAAPDNT